MLRMDGAPSIRGAHREELLRLILGQSIPFSAPNGQTSEWTRGQCFTNRVDDLPAHRSDFFGEHDLLASL
jgi:hypothetical protein